MNDSSFHENRGGQYRTLAFLFLLLSVFFSGVFLIDPTQSSLGFNEIKFIKYLPIELGYLSIFFYLMSGGRVSAQGRLLLLLGWMVLLGGVYTAVIQKQALMDTFVGRGLAFLLVYPAYRMAKSEQQLRLFWRFFAPYLIFLSAVIFAGLLVWSSGYHFISEPHIYHTQVVIPVSAGMVVFTVFRRSSPILAYIVGLLLMSSGILLFKNTSFLLLLFALVLMLYIFWHEPDQRTAFLKRGLIGFAGLGFVLLLVVVLTQVDLAMFYSNNMPSGSPEVRIMTYLKRLDMFLESPLYGTLFVGTPMEVLHTKYGELAVPSHSDLLDILAFGGVLGLLLFLVPIVSTLWRMRGNLKDRWIPQYAMFLWGFAYTGMGMIVLTVNPIWSQPEAFSMFMLGVGVLLAFSEKITKWRR